MYRYTYFLLHNLSRQLYKCFSELVIQAALQIYQAFNFSVFKIVFCVSGILNRFEALGDLG